MTACILCFAAVAHTFSVRQTPEEQIPLDAARVRRERIMVKDDVRRVDHVDGSVPFKAAQNDC